jgi:WD40 repeat protein
VLRAKLSQDRRLAIGTGVDRTVKVWDIQTGKCLQTSIGHSGLIYTLDIAKIQLSGMDSPQTIAFTGSLDETIKVWNLEDPNCLATWKTRRPYERMQIDKIQGLTKAQQSTLQILGAIRN